MERRERKGLDVKRLKGDERECVRGVKEFVREGRRVWRE